MSNMLETIKQDRMKARKQKNQRVITILSTVLGEMETMSSRTRTEVTDAQLISNLDKAITSLKERMALRGEDDNTIFEIDLLSRYVPSKLTEDEIRKIKKDIGATTAKELMPYLSVNYSGLYDGKTASKIANEVV